ncbi:8421_t:CDS:2, partial [Racocetra fulgida]
LPQLLDDETNYEESSEENINSYEVNNETIENGFSSQTFVPSIPPGRSENDAINEALNQMQPSNLTDENSLVDWPYIEASSINEFCIADFRSHRIKEVKPAEYFKHLLLYKDEEKQLTAAEVLDLMQNDPNMANRVVRYGEENSLERETDQEAAKQAPIIEWEKMSNNQEKMKEVVRYLDSLVKTINPDQHAPPPNISYDWEGKNQLRYPELENVRTFIQQAMHNNTITPEIENDVEIDQSTLNKKQKLYSSV